MWHLNGTTYDDGATPIAGIGTGVVETYLGGVFLSRTATRPNSAAVLRIDQTDSSVGGSGGTMNSLLVNTTIPAEASNFGNFGWGITSVLHSNSTGGSQNVAIVGYAYKDSNSDEVWGSNIAALDTTGQSSSVSGAMVGTEIDVNAYGGFDDGGAANGALPANSGIRVGLAIDYGNATSTGQYGWGVVLASDPAKISTLSRAFAVANIDISSAVLDTEFATMLTNADAIRMAAGQDIAFDASGGAGHTLSYVTADSALEYKIAGTKNISFGNGGTTSLLGTTTVGFDTSAGTYTDAYKMGIGQKFAFEGTGTLTVSDVSGSLVWANGATQELTLDMTSGNLGTAGTISGGSYKASGSAGVTCSGTPTASYAVTGGIVTYC